MRGNNGVSRILRIESERAFALVITLTLVALLVLAVFALTSLARVNSRVATASVGQSRAKQNALFALTIALGELQRYAGPDNRVTGMAGVVGVSPQNTFRQWTGVWDGTSTPVWLVSGKSGSLTPTLTAPPLTIVGAHSVGAPADTTDQEPVEVGLIELPGFDAAGFSSKSGRMGYWVGDEGVKVSAIIADNEVQSGGSGSGIRPNFRNLIGSAFDPAASLNSRVISLEQLKLRVAGFSLLPAFHSLTRSHWALHGTASGPAKPGNYVVGAFNINTTSEAAWRALLEFPDSSASHFGITAPGGSLSVARQIRDRIANRGHPFVSINDFTNSMIIQQAFDNASPKVTGITQADFVNELLPILATRSDTFRIRGYGDVLDPVDHVTVSASAYCEAIVQRTPDPAAASLGRRFVVIYFRWLSRDDI